MRRAQWMAVLEMQNDMNAKVNPHWRTAGYPFLRAVVVEAAEAMDHYGWKWWKKQEPDLEQFKIELVDILHFALSDAMMYQRGDVMRIAIQIEDSLELGPVGDGNVLGMLEQMMVDAINGQFSFPRLWAIMEAVGMTWQDMYVGYVSKNVLNFFRQDHGYKNGTYIKSWAPGVEDNVFLSQIVKVMDPNEAGFATRLYDALAIEYVEVLRNHGRLTEAAKLLND